VSQFGHKLTFLSRCTNSLRPDENERSIGEMDMRRWTTCRVLGLLALCLSFDPAMGWAASPQCLQQTWIAAGQRTVTPAVVTGAPLEHLPLKGDNPAVNAVEPDRPNAGYLITGNRVDLVTTCAGFAYVRFHGPKRISTGWVEARRLKTTGPAHGTLPPDVGMLCRAAETTLNEGQQLTTPAESQLDTDDVLTRVHLGPFPNASPPEVAHIVVNGRRMAALVVDGGGTAHDTAVYVFSDDLKSLLSPPRDDRDVGVSEEIVTVMGQPMVRSWGSLGEPSSSFHLSTIDKDGDIVPTCDADRESLNKREIASSTNTNVCRAILAGQQVTVPMQPPAVGESLVRSKLPKQYTSGERASTLADLYYIDKSIDAQVEYTLFDTGNVDIDNSNRLKRIGLVSFAEEGLAATYHPFRDSQIFPVYFEKNGVIDLSSDANQTLETALPHGMQDGKLVSLDGTTYLELSPDFMGPSSEVWKINSSGAQQVCSFKLAREVVSPITQ
jgi:hypothetical protein